MIKKFTAIILLTFLLISCGKKGDPIYDENEENQNSKKIITPLSKLS
tara:strand:- start:3868 stop:4008 length:141 start_codon:yes stop_codon:yes gene_type:complete